MTEQELRDELERTEKEFWDVAHERDKYKHYLFVIFAILGMLAFQHYFPAHGCVYNTLGTEIACEND